MPMRKAKRTASAPANGNSDMFEDRETAVEASKPTPRPARHVFVTSLSSLGFASTYLLNPVSSRFLCFDAKEILDVNRQLDDNQQDTVHSSPYQPFPELRI